MYFKYVMCTVCVWSRYYVSNFARDLLARIHYEPVFDVQDVNPQIYSRVPVLAQARVSPELQCIFSMLFQ